MNHFIIYNGHTYIFTCDSAEDLEMVAGQDVGLLVLSCDIVRIPVFITHKQDLHECNLRALAVQIRTELCSYVY